MKSLAVVFTSLNAQNIVTFALQHESVLCSLRECKTDAVPNNTLTSFLNLQTSATVEVKATTVPQ